MLMTLSFDIQDRAYIVIARLKCEPLHSGSAFRLGEQILRKAKWSKYHMSHLHENVRVYILALNAFYYYMQSVTTPSQSHC